MNKADWGGWRLRGGVGDWSCWLLFASNVAKWYGPEENVSCITNIRDIFPKQTPLYLLPSLPSSNLKTRMQQYLIRIKRWPCPSASSIFFQLLTQNVPSGPTITYNFRQCDILVFDWSAVMFCHYPIVLFYHDVLTVPALIIMNVMVHIILAWCFINYTIVIRKAVIHIIIP